MAEVLLSPLVSIALGKVVKIIADAREQLEDWWEADLGKLQRALEMIQRVLADAEERNDDAVISWLAALKKAAYEAEDILDDFSTHLLHQKAVNKVRGFFSSDNPVLFRLKLGRKLKKIAEKIDRLAEERNRFNFIASSQPQARRIRPQTHSYVDESGVVGRGEDREKIVELLLACGKNGDLSVLPIVGMGGLGKTTLAKLVYRDHRVQNHFQLLLWVCVSDEFDIAKLTQAIITSAMKEECQLSTMDLLQQKLRELLGGKRFLLVMDDIWNEDPCKWKELTDLLKCGGEGSVVIVTTRSRIVSNIVRTLETHDLSYLSAEGSWTLFRKRAFSAFASAEPPENLIRIGEEIVKKCGGLPLTVETLAGLLSYRTEENEWLKVMRSQMWAMPDGEKRILSVLRFSYDHLSSQSKQCFAFCAIFPKDHEIEKELLIQLWMANGYVPSESSGCDIFNELASRCFFQEFKRVNKHRQLVRHGYGRYLVCKMHDLVHDLARSITGNDCVSTQNTDQLRILSKDVRHLSFPGYAAPYIHKISKTFPSIRTLLLGGNQVDVGLSKLKTLRALQFGGRKSFFGMPMQIRYSKHLRFLDLSGSWISTLSSPGSRISTLPEDICTLINLQTLRLRFCRRLRRLPNTISDMGNLRHLDLTGCFWLKQMPPSMGRLSCLQTLTKFIVGDDAARGLGELKDLDLHGHLELNELRKVRRVADAKDANLSSKQNLQSLCLSWTLHGDDNNCNASDAEVLEALVPANSLQSIHVHYYNGVRFSTWMMEPLPLLQNLAEITLGYCNQCEHLPPLGFLPLLEKVVLIEMNAVKHICGNIMEYYAASGARRDVAQAFPKLRSLWLRGMRSLEGWQLEAGRDQVVPLILPCLEELHIKHCPLLTTLPELPSLRSIEVSGCSEFLLPSHEDKMSLMDKDGARGIGSSLQELSITSCNCLFSSPPLGLWKNLTSLQTLRIEKCDARGSWPMEELYGLISLKRLDISNCENLGGISQSSLDFGFPPRLEELRVSFCEGLTELPKLPTALKSLRLISSPSLKTWQEGLESCTALRDLEIMGCPQLTSFPEGLKQRLPSLQRLWIVDCPDLERRCEPGREYWHLVKDIPQGPIHRSRRSNSFLRRSKQIVTSLLPSSGSACSGRPSTL